MASCELDLDVIATNTAGHDYKVEVSLENLLSSTDYNYIDTLYRLTPRQVNRAMRQALAEKRKTLKNRR